MLHVRKQTLVIFTDLSFLMCHAKLRSGNKFIFKIFFLFLPHPICYGDFFHSLVAISLIPLVNLDNLIQPLSWITPNKKEGFFISFFIHSITAFKFKRGASTVLLCSCTHLGFVVSFTVSLVGPLLCHYRVKAWVEKAGEQGSAIFLSLSKIRLCMSPSVCLSV